MSSRAREARGDFRWASSDPAAGNNAPGDKPKLPLPRYRLAMHLSMRKTGLSSPAYADWDYVVCEGGREIARIYEDRHVRPELRWYWSLTVLGAGHTGTASVRVPTLEQAKAQLQTNFKKWLVWAKLEEA